MNTKLPSLPAALCIVMMGLVPLSLRANYNFFHFPAGVGAAADITAAGATICDNTSYYNSYAQVSNPTATIGASPTLVATVSGTGPNGAIASPVFKWYADANLTQLLSTGASYKTAKLTASTTYYVTVQGTGVSQNTPGTALPVSVTVSSVCGLSTDASSCSATGSTLSIQNFGNAGTATQKAASTAPTGLSTTYTFTNSFKPNANQYAVINKTGNSGNATGGNAGYLAWEVVGDHTTTNGTGYMMVVNADVAVGKFFNTTLTNLCPGTKLFFSAWVVSLYKYAGQTNPGINPNLTFNLTDQNSNIVGSLTTGDMPNGDPTWREYGFSFTVPANLTSLNLSIANNAPGGTGNDLALDDIGVYLCAPPVTQGSSSQLTYCPGDNLNLTANYTDDGTFGSPLYYRWYYSSTGDMTSWSSWSAVTAPSTSSALTTSAVQGYYRATIGNLANTTSGSFNCTAASDAFLVTVNRAATSADLTAQNATIASGSTANLTASSTTVTNPVFKWYTDATLGTLLFTGPTYTTPPLTMNTNYYVTVAGDSVCASAAGGQTVTVNVGPPLALKFISFSAASANGGTLLNWIVSADTKYKDFSVQYSTDGANFAEVATVSYNADTASYQYLYPVTGLNTSYFRIIAIDFSGNLTYSEILGVSQASTNNTTLKVSPNPVVDVLTVELSAAVATNATIRIVNTTGGELLSSKQYLNPGAIEKIKLNVQAFSAGVYIVHVDFGNEIKNAQFVKIN